MADDPTERTLLLLALLHSRSGWTVEELAGRLGVSGRTVRRDADRLRRLGYGVVARPGPGSSYRLVPGVALPPLLFDPDEISCVVAGLRLIEGAMPGDDAPARALAKLDRVLPRALRRRAAATMLAVTVPEIDDPGINARAVGVVADAVAQGRSVRFTYRDDHDRPTTRLLIPHRHVHRRGRWYLIGYDVDRDDWRVFRLDRVHDLEVVATDDEAPDFPDASAGRWLATDFGRRSTHAPRGAGERS
ncbi:helix-turn-helix transcriptional regulator [Micromonospora sediminicola]|uniref:helix-turn-helix transcriptional regulator n=1 Tax=Micromonospora sediminicola TaxID=946078 RepID=UPI0037AD6968